ncbi:MAG: DUF5723 family protein [Cellulophaga sp.]
MRIVQFVFVTILMACFSVCGQNKQLLYDFIEVPQALMVNPGMKTSYQWYAGVPLFSGISFQVGSSGISVGDVFANDGRDINDKIRDRVIHGLTPRDEISGTYQIELLSGGFRGRKRPNNFYSFGVYNEGDGIGYWPRDLVILGFEGNADYLGRRFNLSHIKARGEIVNVFHFGINRKLNNKLTVGARGKLYSSVLNFTTTNNKGYFVTTEGERNVFAHTLVADLEHKTSGLNGIKAILDDDTVAKRKALLDLMKKRFLFGGNLGVGVDLGFTYNLDKQIVITGSVLDLGFIYHNKDINSYSLKGEATIEGVEIILPDGIGDPDRDFWQNLVDDIEEVIPFENNKKSYLTFRPTKLNGSIRYNYGEQIKTKEVCECSYKTDDTNGYVYANSIGGQLYVINRPRGPQMALTAFYQRRFGNVLAVKTTYTVDKYSYTNIGFGGSLQLGKVNMYAMVDNLLAYRNLARTRYASFQLGINIISWGKK